MAINLGDINFGLGPDTRRLEAARREVIRFGDAVNRSAEQQGEGARATEAAMRRQEKAITSTLTQILKMNDAIRRTGDNPAQLNRTTATFNRLVRELSQGKVTALQFQRSMEDVKASLSRVARASDMHKDSQNRLAKAQRDAIRAAKEQVAYTVKVERALASAARQVDAYNSALARTKRAPASMRSSGASALSGLQSALGGSMLDPVAFNRASQTFQTQMAKNLNSLRNFQRHGEQTGTAAALERLANVSILLHGPLSGIASRFALIASLTDRINLKTAALVTGISGAAYAFTQMGRAAIESSKVFSRVELSMQAVNGTTAFTANQLKYLMGISDKSGKAFVDVATAFTRIKAAAKGTNLEGDRTNKIFENIIFAGANLGLSNEEVAGSLRAIEQIMSKGTVQAEELRGQLGDRIPGAFNIMADALGVTTEKLGEMMKQGQVTADALLPFAEGLARRYGVDVTKAVDNVVAAEGRLTNAFLRFGKAADNAIGFSEAYKNVLGGVVGALDWLSGNMEHNIKLFGALSGVIAGGLVAMSGPAILAGFVVLARTIGSVTTAIKLMNAAILANPIGGFASLLMKVGLSVAGLVVGYNVMESVVGSADESFGEAETAIRNNAAALEQAASASAGFRKELQTQIEMQKLAATAAWDEALAQLSAAKARMTELTKRTERGGLMGMFASMELGNAEADIQAADNALDSLNEQLTAIDTQLSEIERIRKSLGDKDNPLVPITTGEADGIKGITKAMREAEQSITAARTEYELLMMPPGQQEFVRMQMSINEQVSAFKDKLVDAKVPLQDVTTMTNAYRAQLTLLEEQQYRLKYFPDMWTELGKVLGDGMDQAMGQLIDNWMAGGDALKGLADIGRMVAADLIKTFATLAVINPLKNLLGLGGGTMMPTFNPLAFFGGGMPRLAGGGEFEIGGSGGTGRLDNQLVQFMGKTGEKVKVTKSGHSDGGDGDYYEGNTYYIDAQGSEAGVEERIMSAIKAYDRTSLVRQQKNAIKGKLYRKPGMV